MIDWLSPSIILPEDHAAIGALAAMVAYAFAPGGLGQRSRRGLTAARAGVVVFVVIVLVKELLWDPVNEVNQPFLWSGVTDLTWYLVGISAVLLALWLRFRQV